MYSLVESIILNITYSIIYNEELKIYNFWGYGMKEKDLEDLLLKYPYLIEEGLTLKERHVRIYSDEKNERYIDLVGCDKNNLPVYIEIKKTKFYQKDLGQAIEYYSLLKRIHKNKKFKFVVIAKTIPEPSKIGLQLLGIKYLEFGELPKRRIKFSINKKITNQKFESFKKLVEKTIEMPEIFPDEVAFLPLTDDEWKNIFTEKRIELIREIGKNPESITQLAKALNRHQEAISRDIKFLEFMGVIKIESKGKQKIPVINKKLIVMPLPISIAKKVRV